MHCKRAVPKSNKIERQLESKSVLIQIADALKFDLRSSLRKFAAFTRVKYDRRLKRDPDSPER
jgi:hypothetical protein